MSDKRSADAARISIRERGVSIQQRSEKSADDLDRDRFRSDQSFIAKYIVWLFGIAVVVTLLGVILAPLLTPDWKALIPLMLEVLKTAVVPMVALVIGYYLPKSAR